MSHNHSHNHSHESKVSLSSKRSFLFNKDTLSFWGVFLLVNIRLISSISIHIDDCDETFNYWEPLHFLIFGHGLQTWEYSPQYALRSYPYLLPLLWIGGGLKYLFGSEKIVIYYALRGCISLFSAYCEIQLILSFGKRFGRLRVFTKRV